VHVIIDSELLMIEGRSHWGPSVTGKFSKIFLEKKIEKYIYIEENFQNLPPSKKN
jgi:hypothetical protein